MNTTTSYSSTRVAMHSMSYCMYVLSMMYVVYATSSYCMHTLGSELASNRKERARAVERFILYMDVHRYSSTYIHSTRVVLRALLVARTS